MVSSAQSPQLFLLGGGAGKNPVSPELAGSKAAGLSRMARLGIEIPPAFVISTQLCGPVNSRAPGAEDKLTALLREGMDHLEEATGLRFAGRRNPLFVSVRSGAPRSMPGMMDTILNVGMNPDSVRGLIRRTGNPRLAWDCYRRFIESFTESTGGSGLGPFARALRTKAEGEQVHDEAELDPSALEELTAQYAQIAESLLGAPIPSSPMEQLRVAAEAVYASWESAKVKEYRRVSGLDDMPGTAVMVQVMVYGNSGFTSGSGVAFTRNPATGEKSFYADFLFDAQGEDVVAGRRMPGDIGALGKRLPEVADKLIADATRLEREFGDMQDIEFTVDDGKLYFLQTRPGKRTPRAALRILLDLLEDGIIDKAEGAKRAASLPLDAIAITRFEGEGIPAATGNGASAGVASGRIAFDSDAAVKMAGSGEPVILVRPETSTADIAGFAAASGILTAIGGRTAHAAVVARQLGKVCVAGCDRLVFGGAGQPTLNGHPLHEGDWISIDGGSGEVFPGKRPIVIEQPLEELRQLREVLA